MQFQGDADGVHLVGDWDRETSFSPELLGEAAEHGVIRTTIKIKTAESWALYRVTGCTRRFVPEMTTIQAKLLRRGRADRLPKSDKS